MSAQRKRLALTKPLSPREALNVAIGAFEQRCKAKNATQGTIQYYRYRFNAFTRFLDEQGLDLSPAEIDNVTIRDFLAEQLSRVSAVTAHHSYLTLNCFFNFLVEDGFIEQTPLTGVEHPRQKKPIIPTFTQEQITDMLNTCREKSFIPLRDKAIIMLLFDSGLRVSELCGLTVDTINWSEQTMFVLGKGNKERLVPFGSSAKQALLAYMARRGELPTKHFFVNSLGETMTRRRVLEMIHERGETAGVRGVRCSPHTIRHTFAVNYLRAGGDVFSLQRLLGHSDLTMTRRYAELSQNDVIEKHRVYSPGDKFLSNLQADRKRKRLK